MQSFLAEFFCASRTHLQQQRSRFFHIKIRYVTRSSTSPDKPSSLTAYAVNPSSTRAAAEQKGYVSYRGSTPETWGEMLIRGLWERYTESIIDLRFGYAEVDTYKK